MSDNTDDNVIYLSVVAPKYRPDRCRHKRIEVDEELAVVECSICGEKLNPMAVLSRFAREETQLLRRIDELNKIKEKLEHKSRCKCEHCGCMTRIPVK